MEPTASAAGSRVRPVIASPPLGSSPTSTAVAPGAFRQHTRIVLLGALCLGLVILPAAIPAWAGSPAAFTEEATARGITYVMQDYPQGYGYLGFGAGFADLDADGDPDVVVVGAADGGVGIFENDGAGNFTDRSATHGIPALPQGSGWVAFDYDGDRDLDLYFTQVGEANVLARNLGGFLFEDVTATALVGDAGAGKGPAVADFDGDGWLDLYVPNYNGIVSGTEDLDNKLYRNLGNGTFEDVSETQTVDDEGKGFQAVWMDYDVDGRIDLYLSNDRGHFPANPTNQLWRNVEGQLTNVSVGSGADVGLFSMGLACGDLDGNGYPDFYCTNVAVTEGVGPGLNPLLLNQGDGTFEESSESAGVDHYITSWGAIFFDYDNDGRLDLYVNNMLEANSLYDCDGFPCVDRAGALLVGGGSAGSPTNASFSSAVADVDADGDLDLLLNDLGRNVELFINHEGAQRHWLGLRVEGLEGNLHAVGARVTIEAGGSQQIREILAGGNGYLGQNELVLSIGLDTSKTADTVEVVWPGGEPSRQLSNLPADWRWTVYPPEALGDADWDGDVDLEDFWAFEDCFEATFEPGCEVMDFDGDSDVTVEDFDAFLSVYSAPIEDCNGNEQPDLEEILLGLEVDADGDGVLDVCELIFSDSFETGTTENWIVSE